MRLELQLPVRSSQTDLIGFGNTSAQFSTRHTKMSLAVGSFRDRAIRWVSNLFRGSFLVQTLNQAVPNTGLLTYLRQRSTPTPLPSAGR